MGRYRGCRVIDRYELLHQNKKIDIARSPNDLGSILVVFHERGEVQNNAK